MQIAGGRKTVDEVHADTSHRAQEHRNRLRYNGENHALTVIKSALDDEDDKTGTSVLESREQALAAGFTVRQANRIERFWNSVLFLSTACESTEGIKAPEELDREHAKEAAERIKAAEIHLRIFRRKLEKIANSSRSGAKQAEAAA